jgi:uncharacterized RmlC-like cupin family protein
MARIIKRKNLGDDRVYQPPQVIGFGVNSDTVDNPKMTIGHAVLPPGGRSQRHYHTNCNAGGYVIRGRQWLFLGPDDDMQKVIMEAGDFYFVAKGEIHGGLNLSDTEPVEVVFVYEGAANKEEAGTVFVEHLY